jgi:hypothetical protein
LISLLVVSPASSGPRLACLQALGHKGCVKASYFKNSGNKLAHRYLLTPRGIEEKAMLTVGFLRIKMREFELPRVAA